MVGGSAEWYIRVFQIHLLYYVSSDNRVACENRHWLPLRPFPFPLPLPRLPEAAPPLPFPCPLRLDRGPRSGYIWIPFGGSCVLDPTQREPNCRHVESFQSTVWRVLLVWVWLQLPLTCLYGPIPNVLWYPDPEPGVLDRAVGGPPFCCWIAFWLFVPVLRGQLVVAGTIERLLPRLVRFPHWHPDLRFPCVQICPTLI